MRTSTLLVILLRDAANENVLYKYTVKSENAQAFLHEFQRDCMKLLRGATKRTKEKKIENRNRFIGARNLVPFVVPMSYRLLNAGLHAVSPA
jgi:hypothetical protein